MRIRDATGPFPAWLLAGALLGCGGDNGTGPTRSGNGGGLTLVAGFGVTDTVLTQPIQALVVEVRDSDGTPATGSVVRFQALAVDTAHPYTPSMYVAPLGGTYFGTFVADTVDTRGRAGALLAFGTVAGPGRITIVAPEFGVEDTVHYTVVPGNAAAIVISPRDTAVYASASFQAASRATDRFGNPRNDLVTYSSATAGIAITAAGRVTAQAVNRAHYLVSVPGFTDTGWVSVVPTGTLAAFHFDPSDGPVGLVTVNLDGSGYTYLTPASGELDIAPSWNPSGTSIVYGSSANGGPMRLFSVDLAGHVTRFLNPSATGVVEESWPHYSHDGAFVYYTGSVSSGVQVWRAASDGSGSALVYADPSGIAWRPSPSPDGTRVAFVRPDPNGAAVAVYDLTSQTVSTWSVVGQSPRWSPTGDVIAFAHVYGGALSIVNPDGTGGRTITPTGQVYAEGAFGWSPDGVWVVARGALTLELINVQSGLRLPLGFSSRLTQPAWKP